jgi:ADP-ribose pyrophosphatase YjhB (NUDIX family)
VNVAIWFKDKILLVRPGYKNVYSLPGGYIKRGENRKTAAIRELEEELNLTAFRKDLKYVDTILTTDEYKYDFYVHFRDAFLARTPHQYRSPGDQAH